MELNMNKVAETIAMWVANRNFYAECGDIHGVSKANRAITNTAIILNDMGLQMFFGKEWGWASVKAVFIMKGSEVVGAAQVPDDEPFDE